jgi:hypothetical protein
MNAYEIEDLIGQQPAIDASYVEFLRVSDLSMGLYTLPAGGVDPQQPHGEDEVYYVFSGAAVIRVDKGVDHRFHSITEDLKILVFFAPAESG